MKNNSLDISQQDLKDIGEWLNTTPENIQINIQQEPISKFLKQIIEMQSSYDEFPQDAKRTLKIVNLLKKGDAPLPIYVEENDESLFVMEGRHRMVAFFIIGLPK